MRAYLRQGSSGPGAGAWATGRAITVIAATVVVATMALAPNAAGSVTALGRLAGDSFSGAEAINDHGIIVGFSGPAADQIHAVKWRLSDNDT